MKHLFICSTPLQLMTAINLRVSKLFDDDVTVYILNHSHSSEDLYKKIHSAKIFTNVFFIKTKDFNARWLHKYKITRYSIKIFEYFIYKRIVEKFVNDEKTYDRFWVSFIDYSTWLIYLTYKEKNKNLESHLQIIKNNP